MGKPINPHFYDFGIWGRVPEPQNQYYLSLETTGYLKELRNTPCNILNHMISINIEKLEIHLLDNYRKDVRRKNPTDPFNKLLKIFDMGSISIKKHEIGFWSILE